MGAGVYDQILKDGKSYTNYLDKRPGQTIVGVCWKSGFAPSWPSIYPRLTTY